MHAFTDRKFQRNKVLIKTEAKDSKHTFLSQSLQKLKPNKHERGGVGGGYAGRAGAQCAGSPEFHSGTHILGMVECTCNPSIREVEAGELEVQSHSLLHNKFRLALDLLCSQS